MSNRDSPAHRKDTTDVISSALRAGKIADSDELWNKGPGSSRSGTFGDVFYPSSLCLILITEMVELSKFRHDERISDEVKDGSIAYALVRPYNYLIYHFSNGLGEPLVKMVLIFCLGLPLVLIYAGRPNIEPQHLPLVALIFILALVLDFAMASSIGLLAFVTEDTFSFRLIYQKLIFILGGLLIPVDFLPGRLQEIARVLPFAQTTYAPAKLFVAFSWPQFAQVLFLQLFWIAVMSGLLMWQYRWAARRLSINGG